MKIPVPATGNRSFERVLKAIDLDEVVRPAQITKFVAPRTRLIDPVDHQGQFVAYGQLQQRDLQEVRKLFQYPDFVARVISNTAIFETEEARVFQFHHRSNASVFVYGLFVTDSQFNLVDFCLDSPRRDQRRTVLQPLMRAVCTAQSVHGRLQ